MQWIGFRKFDISVFCFRMANGYHFCIPVQPGGVVTYAGIKGGGLCAALVRIVLQRIEL